MWMLAVALLHSISHGERCRPRGAPSGRRSAAGEGSGRRAGRGAPGVCVTAGSGARALRHHLFSEVTFPAK